MIRPIPSLRVPRAIFLALNKLLWRHELTTEPFRWDQRLFSIILRMPGTRSSMPGKIGVQSNEPAIAAMCEVTGGNLAFLDFIFLDKSF